MKKYSIERDGIDATEPRFNPFSVLRASFDSLDLIRELIGRDIAGRYRGSVGGILWSLVQPLFMLGVYTAVFGVLFKMRWGGADSTLEFSLVLFSGLIVFNFFAECMNRAPVLVTGQPNLVKKVVFPLEIFPFVAMGSALFHAFIAFIAWLLFYFVIYGLPPLTIVLVPLILLPLLPVVLGLGWILSAIGAYLRDTAQLTGIITQAFLFISPVFYSLDIVPPVLRPFILANPLTFIIEQARKVMLEGGWPDFAGLAIYLLLALLFSWAGIVLFQKLRSGFADVV